MEILGAIAGVAGVVVAVIGTFVMWRIARTQDQHQRELETRQDQLRRDSEKKQQIRATCDRLSDHLTKWHDALRAAVLGEDQEELRRLRNDLYDYTVMMSKMEAFRGNETYEGPLGYILLDLTKYPECSQVIEKVNAFQKLALDFKKGEIGRLEVMVQGGGHWSETKHSAPTEYHESKVKGLEEIRSAYQDAMKALQALKGSLA